MPPSVHILLLATAIWMCRCQDLASICPNAMEDMKTCSRKFLTDQNLPGSAVQTLENPRTAISSNVVFSNITALLCGNHNIKEFYTCFMEKIVSCLPPEWKRAFPTLRQLHASQDYICDNIKDVDLNCIMDKNRMNTMLTCLKESMDFSSMDPSDAEGFIEFLCSMYPVSMNCMQSAFRTCPRRTAEVLVRYTELQRPEGCGGCSLAPLLSLLLSLACLLLWGQNLEE